MIQIEIVKRFSFDAAHFLPNHKGKCKGVHGHHWVLEVGVKGYVNKDTGMVVDFADIKEAVQGRIINELDHKFLNEIKLNSFPSNQPTSENIIKWIVGRLDNPFLLKNLSFVRLCEGDIAHSDYVEWRKPDRINEEWDNFINKEEEKKQAWRCLLQAGRRLLDEMMQDDD